MTPKELTQLTDEEFEKLTLELIQRELGLSGLARFIKTYRSGHADYTAERYAWLNGLTIADIARELQQS